MDSYSAAPDASDTRDFPDLRQALHAAGIDVVALRPMADTGLAHEHVWLHRHDGNDWVARLPKQSQMDLAPRANLDYQASCFARASQGGHTPALEAVLPPSDHLPRGGLVVSAVEGRPARLPEDLPAIARALASIHAQPLPPASRRAPLHAPESPWQALMDEIDTQARYLPEAQVDPATQRRIVEEIARLRASLGRRRADARTLISFDAHPGNFLVDAGGTAMLVDLEKCRYGVPGMDLAHASLYTSTTWDVASHAALEIDAIVAFYRHWAEAMRAAGCDHLVDDDALLAARRGMWLWSLTWCAKWRALHLKPRDTAVGGEDWSAALSDDALIAHVADRVDHYLSPAIVTRVVEEWRHLATHLRVRTSP